MTLDHPGDPNHDRLIDPVPTDWEEFLQTHDDRDVTRMSPDELPVIDIHSLRRHPMSPDTAQHYSSTTKLWTTGYHHPGIR